jgi:hypothetical protein
MSCSETEMADTGGDDGDEVRGDGFGGVVGAGSGGVVKTSPSWLSSESLAEPLLAEFPMELRCESVDRGDSVRATAANV